MSKDPAAGKCSKTVSLSLIGSALFLSGCGGAEPPPPVASMAPDWAGTETVTEATTTTTTEAGAPGSSPSTTHGHGYSGGGYRPGRAVIVAPVPIGGSRPAGPAPSVGGGKPSSAPSGVGGGHASSGSVSRGGFGSTGHASASA